MFRNPKLLATLAAVAAEHAGDPGALRAEWPDPLDEMAAMGCAVKRGFVTTAPEPDLTEAGLAWAAEELAPLAALRRRVAP